MQDNLKYYKFIILHSSSSDIVIIVQLNRHNVSMQASGCAKIVAATHHSAESVENLLVKLCKRMIASFKSNPFSYMLSFMFIE